MKQPWRGTSIPETDWVYMLMIIADIADWKIQSVVGQVSYYLQSLLEPQLFDHQSSLSIRYQILENIPAIMKHRISVTRI